MQSPATNKHASQHLETDAALDEGRNFSKKRKSVMWDEEMNQQAKNAHVSSIMNEKLWGQVCRYNPQNEIRYLHSIA